VFSGSASWVQGDTGTGTTGSGTPPGGGGWTPPGSSDPAVAGKDSAAGSGNSTLAPLLPGEVGLRTSSNPRVRAGSGGHSPLQSECQLWSAMESSPHWHLYGHHLDLHEVCHVRWDIIHSCTWQQQHLWLLSMTPGSSRSHMVRCAATMILSS
jgi:hypothetical protein